MLLQAESIKKYLEPCEHIVIVEDDNFNSDYWINLLSPYYNNHKLNLKSYNHFKIKGNGWLKQQCYKLLASIDCQDDYLILDSKDFFIRNVSLEEWKYQKGSNLIKSITFDKKTIMNSFASHDYACYFNTQMLYDVYASVTPFVININNINIDNILKDVLWFNNNSLTTDYFPSEFLFYSYMARKDIEQFKQIDLFSDKLWDCKDLDNFDNFKQNIAHNDNFKVFGVRRSLAQCNSKNKNELLNWILSLGLTNNPW